MVLYFSLESKNNICFVIHICANAISFPYIQLKEGELPGDLVAVLAALFVFTATQAIDQLLHKYAASRIYP